MAEKQLGGVKGGGIWTSIGALVGAGAQFAAVGSVAFFLDPLASGEFAIALFLIGFLSVMLPLGNDFAIVMRRSISRPELTGIIVRAVALTVLALLICVGIYAFVPSATQGFRESTAIISIISGLSESVVLIIVAVKQRDLKYKEIEISNIIRYSLFAILSIGLLLVWHDVIGAIIARIVGSVVAIVLLMRNLPLNTESEEHPKDNTARDITLKNIVNYLSMNAEILAASPKLGIAGIGLYDFGRRLVAQPRNLIGTVVFKFTFPLFSRISRITRAASRERAFRLVYVGAVRAALIFGLPIIGVISILTQKWLAVIFGAEWTAAVSVVQVFALTSIIQIVGNNLITAALTARGKANIILMSEVISVLPRMGVIYLASFYGVTAVAVMTGVFIVFKIISMQYLLFKFSSLRAGHLLKAIMPVIGIFVIAWGSGLLVDHGIPGIPGTILSLLIYSIMYLAGIYIFERKVADDMIHNVRKIVTKAAK
ncbi:oligosaccharide flippase family protein [Novosphingobium sp. SL115]|uniref:oligosaccharide flippase family protein n=1 Tax=Novosphingobium sp. SL115 TaxID=2995150 RepID=UPI0022767B3B|nr:oligosaccharide flippase family protein [Novosphingobium sp. SL115]MCY1669475.1 oligosaccharide flippase family protein [Novosphingobium sp. SL115]